MDIVARYCTNYNGFYLRGVEEDSKADEVCTNVIDALVGECDDDGEFCGDIDEAKKIIIREVKAAYGDDVNVIVEFDNISS